MKSDFGFRSADFAFRSPRLLSPLVLQKKPWDLINTKSEIRIPKSEIAPRH